MLQDWDPLYQYTRTASHHAPRLGLCRKTTLPDGRNFVETTHGARSIGTRSILTAELTAIFREIAGVVTPYFELFVHGLMLDEHMTTVCYAVTTLLFRCLL